MEEVVRVNGSCWKKECALQMDTTTSEDMIVLPTMTASIDINNTAPPNNHIHGQVEETS